MTTVYQINESTQLQVPYDRTRKPLPGKTAWLAALRGGFYKKGIGTLCDDQLKTYCCLGVLSAVQCRLQKDEQDTWCDSHRRVEGVNVPVHGSYGELDVENPLVCGGYMTGSGIFPDGCVVVCCYEEGFYEVVYSLAVYNDMSDGAVCTFQDVANVIDLLWFDPATENQTALDPAALKGVTLSGVTWQHRD
jgi:hypothetical protein